MGCPDCEAAMGKLAVQLRLNEELTDRLSGLASENTRLREEVRVLRLQAGAKPRVVAQVRLTASALAAHEQSDGDISKRRDSLLSRLREAKMKLHALQEHLRAVKLEEELERERGRASRAPPGVVNLIEDDSDDEVEKDQGIVSAPAHEDEHDTAELSKLRAQRVALEGEVATAEAECDEVALEIWSVDRLVDAAEAEEELLAGVSAPAPS